jgi:carboxymethylenebutenolidase
LSNRDPNADAALVLSSTVALRSATDEPSGPIAVVGFSMGASWAIWAATRQPESFSKVAVYYGTQSIDFDDLTAAIQGHFAEHDELVGDDAVVELEADLFERGHEPEMWHYAGVRHWFAEPGDHGAYDEPAAALAWQRTLDFLKRP